MFLFQRFHEVGPMRVMSKVFNKRVPFDRSSLVGGVLSWGVHESQSRSIDEPACPRSRAFSVALWGKHVAMPLGDFWRGRMKHYILRIVNRVSRLVYPEPNRMRLQYNYMWLRGSIWKCVNGRRSCLVGDLEAAWNDRFKATFGVWPLTGHQTVYCKDVTGRWGCSDIFPTFILVGNVYAGFV